MAEGDTEEEKIVKKFYGEEGEVDDESNNIFKGLGVSKDEEFAFNFAFKVVAGDDVETVDADQVQDIFLAFGYTFPPSDIEKYVILNFLYHVNSWSLNPYIRILENAIPNAQNRFTPDALVDGLRHYKTLN